MRMSIYGKSLNEWDDLARWLKSSDLHRRLGVRRREGRVIGPWEGRNGVSINGGTPKWSVHKGKS